MPAATDIEKTTSIVPEFFFDLISRIIPGFFVIILFWYPEKLGKDTFDLATYSIFFFFAYGIGLILEVVIDFSFAVVGGLFKSLINSVQGVDSCHPLVKIIDYLDTAEVWKKIRSKSSDEQILLKKFMAEKAFCRTIFCLQLFLFLRSILFEPKITLHGDEIPACYFFYTTVVALICFFRLGWAANHTLEILSTPSLSETSSP